METFSKSSFLEVPVFFCENCYVYFSGNSENEMKDKCIEVYSKEFWGENNLWDAKKIIESNYQDDESQGKKRTWDSQYSYCIDFLKEEKEILEIGAGQGQASYWFEQKGHKIISIEPDKKNVELINKKLRRGKCIVSDAENFCINKKFDVIWVSHVLEHMINPHNFLKKIINCLKNNGVLFIEVPNCGNESVLNTSIKKVPHTFHFSMRSAVILLEQHKFEIIKSDYFRPAKKIDAIKNKIDKSYHPFYPRIVTNEKNGKYFRIIAQKNQL